MQWIGYALVSTALWGGWAFFGKVALRHASWAQVSFVYGAITAVFFGALLLGPARRGFSPSSWWSLAVSATCGALGLATFYLALDRGKASAVVPMISAYPIITSALALAFLGESMRALQLVGVCLVIGGVILVGAGS
jgi:transporter family protein